MAVLKCEICGGNLSLNKGDKIAVCDSCGTQQTVFYFDDSSKSDSNRFTIVQKPDFEVDIKELTENDDFLNSSALTVALGKDYKGNAIYGDLEQLQHLLITGASGYGKTNCLRSIVYSLICKRNVFNPKLLLIDPKKIEFTDFENIPNLLVPVVTDAGKASGALGWVVSESLSRIQAFSDCSVRDIEGYNRFVEKYDDMEPLPYLVIVIDDLYQVLSNAPKEVEDSILKIVQNGRICGIHMVVSSLQADRKFLPDKIKNSISSKLSFVLRTKAESKYILDRSCAEKLTTVGDMLYLPLGTTELKQIKCCYISDETVEELTTEIKSQAELQYSENIEREIIDTKPAYYKLQNEENNALDPLFEQAVEVVINNGRASTSFLQRKLDIGYVRSSKLMEQLEERGVIGSQDGASPREIRINMQQWQQIKSCEPLFESSGCVDEMDQLVREINAATKSYSGAQTRDFDKYIHQKIHIDKKVPEGTATFEIEPNQLDRVEFTKAKLFKKGQISIFFKYDLMYEIKQEGHEFPLIRNADHVTISFDKNENEEFYQQYQQLNALINK